ncbi:hypothetical protein BBI01_01325 [Chryseobacterium artocarpi]|uniref:Uncharacterized protein n=1 Tax=Chryseobacterium artocarpi TaxID=1414727 RepID=A0A1B8ZZY5_9FLAO|nr:hypothetical protein [Chryseobacterium artocarpi]OCA77132.1 hypothetical protein BBI01_01325 [Chryseobacterium artocarpi]
MKRTYTLETFTALDLNTKSFIIEDRLTDDYYDRQTELFSVDLDTVYTEELEREHDILFVDLIEELSLKLFAECDVLEYDFEKRKLEVGAANEVFINIIEREGSVTIRPEDCFFDPKLN